MQCQLMTRESTSSSQLHQTQWDVNSFWRGISIFSFWSSISIFMNLRFDKIFINYSYDIIERKGHKILWNLQRRFDRYQRSVNFEMSFWCLHFLPKNERKQVDLRFHSSKVELATWELVRSFFGRNVGLKKSFEFVWHLAMNSEKFLFSKFDRLICLRKPSFQKKKSGVTKIQQFFFKNPSLLN